MREPGGAVIRLEQPGDVEPIKRVNEAAFGGSLEANLVDSLRDAELVLLSAVAEVRGAIVGHILFSRMWIDTPAETIDAAALAPMAVLPEHQRRGVGGTLIEYGVEALRARGERIVIVVGHPEYYPRFRFSSARARGLASPFPPDAFMALELVPGALDGISGRVRYPPAFGL